MEIFKKEIHGCLDILVISLHSFISCLLFKISLGIVRLEGSTDCCVLVSRIRRLYFFILLMIFMSIRIVGESRPSMIKIDSNLPSNDEG